MSKLNKEEKRRLEKLAIAEIAEARSSHIEKRNKEEEALVKKLNTKVPADVRAKHIRLMKLEKEVEAIKKWFNRSEYTAVSASNGNYSNGYERIPAHVEVRDDHYGDEVHSDIKKFRATSNKLEKKFDELEKNFSLRLLDSEDAVALFAELQKELASLI